MARWRLSPWCGFLEDTRRSELNRLGLFHRLSGAAFGISRELQEILLDVSEESFSLDEIIADGESGALRRLIDAKMVVPQRVDCTRDWLDCHVIRPRLNPAVVWRDGEGNRHVVRLLNSSRCELPRQRDLPELAEEILPPDMSCVWDLADGAHTLRQISRQIPGSRLLAALQWLTEPGRQMIRLTGNPSSPEGPLRASDFLCQTFVASASSAARSAAYYESQISDAGWQFDWIEPTVSHALRVANPGLHGRSYGQQFAASVLKQVHLPEAARVLEIGGGLGYFARDFIAAATKELGHSIQYSIVDLSPELIRHQREILGSSSCFVEFYQQNAQDLALPGRYELMIANEVIADLAVDDSRAKNGGAATGITLLLDRVWQHLAPGGAAFLCEYGNWGRGPKRVEHLDHPEFEVDYSQVSARAGEIGFAVQMFNLADFLEADPNAMFLRGQQEHILCLNRILRRCGAELPYAAHARDDFLAHIDRAMGIESISGYSFSRLSDGLHFGPDIRQFRVLMLTKPARAPICA